jgi:hypothetical protein
MSKEKKSGKHYKPKRDATGKFISSTPNPDEQLATKGDIKRLVENNLKNNDLILYCVMMFWVFTMTLLIFTLK